MSTLREAVTILLGALDNWKLTGAVDAAKAEVRLAMAHPPSPDYVRGQERMRERAAASLERHGRHPDREGWHAAAKWIRSLPLEDAGEGCTCDNEQGCLIHDRPAAPAPSPSPAPEAKGTAPRCRCFHAVLLDEGPYRIEGDTMHSVAGCYSTPIPAAPPPGDAGNEGGKKP